MSIERRWQDFWARYERGAWEPETRRWLQANLSPGDLFLDIGAWIGPVTLWALECGAHVIAVEPDPVALEELRRKAPGAEIWEGAVTVDGAPTYLTPRRVLGDSMSRISDEGTAVQSWTLERILDGRTPDLAKIDIEGYELTLLPSIAPALAEMGVPVQVALHDGLPDISDFAGYDHIRMPSSARDRGGRSNHLLAC